MPKKTKKQENAEFLAKIKTISVNTGGKSPEKSSYFKCVDCGKPLGKHELIPVAAVLLGTSGPRKNGPKEKPQNNETSFAA